MKPFYIRAEGRILYIERYMYFKNYQSQPRLEHTFILHDNNIEAWLGIDGHLCCTNSINNGLCCNCRPYHHDNCTTCLKILNP